MAPDRNLHDDDQLLAALGEAFDAAEPVSPAALDAAKAAVDLGRIEGELAELISDSYADDASALALRANETIAGRILSYEHAGISLELDLPADGAQVVGDVDLADGISGPIEVFVESARATDAVEVDELGRFQTALRPGRVRFVVRAGGVAMTTPWITR